MHNIFKLVYRRQFYKICSNTYGYLLPYMFYLSSSVIVINTNYSKNTGLEVFFFCSFKSMGLNKMKYF